MVIRNTTDKPGLWIYLAALFVLGGCATAALHLPEPSTRGAPLYWTVYEYHYTRERQGVKDNYITEADFLANVEWVQENLLPYGVDMVCVDGWGDKSVYNDNGYRTKHSRHWEKTYEEWSRDLRERGMKLGIYENPLWIEKSAANLKVAGTDILIGSLVDHDETSAFGFTWVQVDRPGAEDYVRGFVRYYAGIGVDFLRVDFLSWYETGTDDGMGVVGKTRWGTGHPRKHYETALGWMRDECDKQGVFLSLVMPHLYKEAELEARYGHLFRVNDDCAEGGWFRFSDNARGYRKQNWSPYRNPFDGYTYWSYLTGPGKVRLDGDFIRLNTFADDEERKSVLSLHVIAGGPVSIADQHDTIGDHLWVYQNRELLDLAREGFIGKPLVNDPEKDESQIWKGRAACGIWIVAFFNRERRPRERSIEFSKELGIQAGEVREIWSGDNLGLLSSLRETIPPHGCRVYRIKE